MNNLIWETSTDTGNIEGVPPFLKTLDEKIHITISDSESDFEELMEAWPNAENPYIKIRRSESSSEEHIKASSSSEQDYESQKHLQEAEKQFANELSSLILDEAFEYGVDTKADALVRHYMELHLLLTKEWLNSMFVENFSNTSVLVGLLRIIARLDYSEIYPQGQTMAVAALSHENTEVQECGVRAFESWETSESLQILENLKVSTQWFQEYIDEVVLYLRKVYDVPADKKNKQK